jgi:hypothetical protein
LMKMSLPVRRYPGKVQTVVDGIILPTLYREDSTMQTGELRTVHISGGVHDNKG